MLVLNRKIGERIVIGTDIVVTVVAVLSNQVRLGIEAPSSVPIRRMELLPRTTSDLEPSPARVLELAKAR
jgi:carbon storage regulator